MSETPKPTDAEIAAFRAFSWGWGLAILWCSLLASCADRNRKPERPETHAMSFFEVERGSHVNLDAVAAVLPNDPGRPDPSCETASVVLLAGGHRFEVTEAAAGRLAREMVAQGRFFSIDERHGVGVAHVAAVGPRTPDDDEGPFVVHFSTYPEPVVVSAEAGVRLRDELAERE